MLLLLILPGLAFFATALLFVLARIFLPWRSALGLAVVATVTGGAGFLLTTIVQLVTHREPASDAAAVALVLLAGVSGLFFAALGAVAFLKARRRYIRAAQAKAMS
ncbi:FtsH-binding integral membrane protein [Caulobacter ginsengisoli]|uniref:FtsH-binding integral membrane protein n=1 Tax=Caulobacter ginsengisoli TaxID=400775 RepID=A0ABU0IP22_9CAUL|nr:hypothetical protein [Caulobacter ginsengisoli]MDQ0463751.1 FtsH-binding integral membrane protein [Caulobacter ginsengisoli]